MDLSRILSNNKLSSETLDIIQNGSYMVGNRKFDIEDVLTKSIESTILYSPSDVEEIQVLENELFETRIEVTDESTIQACRRLSSNDGVVALNFASARTPGGGWLTGAKAQEESIAYASGLYPTIAQMTEMYEYNRKLNGLYSNCMIYSPNVPIFRNANNQLVAPCTCSFITAPAVNASNLFGSVRENIEPTMIHRINRILAVALEHADKHLILGAFGCGVFKNDPYKVARYFKDQLQGSFKGKFESITFAIYDNTPSKTVLKTFQSVFE